MDATQMPLPPHGSVASPTPDAGGASQSPIITGQSAAQVESVSAWPLTTGSPGEQMPSSHLMSTSTVVDDTLREASAKARSSAAAMLAGDVSAAPSVVGGTTMVTCTTWFHCTKAHRL